MDESKVDMSRKMTISGPLDQVLESLNYTFRRFEPKIWILKFEFRSQADKNIVFGTKNITGGGCYQFGASSVLQGFL